MLTVEVVVASLLPGTGCDWLHSGLGPIVTSLNRVMGGGNDPAYLGPGQGSGGAGHLHSGTKETRLHSSIREDQSLPTTEVGSVD